jgi:hypothetical protein
MAVALKRSLELWLWPFRGHRVDDKRVLSVAGRNRYTGLELGFNFD